MKTWIALLLIAAAPVVADQRIATSDPAAASGYGAFPVSTCLTDADQRALTSKLGLDRPRPTRESSQGTVLYADPVSGGINGTGRTVVNYVDLDPTAGLLDYACGVTTYDGHRGLDVDIPFFYDMDEGVPILCAAPGTVVD